MIRHVLNMHAHALYMASVYMYVHDFYASHVYCKLCIHVRVHVDVALHPHLCAVVLRTILFGQEIHTNFSQLNYKLGIRLCHAANSKKVFEHFFRIHEGYQKWL